MIINTFATLALYCPRCGKLHMHDISRFELKNTNGRKLLCSCGQVQASITSVGERQCLLDIPCVLCQKSHKICLDSNRFWHASMDKIYCIQEKFELGFVGKRQVISDTIDTCKMEFEKMSFDMGIDEYDDYIQNPQVMFETLNKIHDIAEKGKVYCRCGSSAIGAEVLPEGIELECGQCGGYLIIPAQSEKDLTYVEGLEFIEIIPARRSHRKH